MTRATSGTAGARTLDEHVREAAEALADVARPDALYLLGTGPELLGERLEEAREVALADVAGVPCGWRDAVLLAGRLGPLGTWIVGDPGAVAEREPAWSPGFPCWLAAARGARVLVHSAAGCGLPGGPPRGALALVSDHLRFGDHNPLLGLGESALGPLFPDLTRLHDAELRERVLDLARSRGLEACEAVAACTPGPSLDTPAERELLAGLGAEVLLQGASAAFLAAGHAGLAVLSVTAVTDAGLGEARLDAILEASRALAPALDELLEALAAPAAERCAELRRERGA